jgi:hypothetical protein
MMEPNENQQEDGKKIESLLKQYKKGAKDA